MAEGASRKRAGGGCGGDSSGGSDGGLADDDVCDDHDHDDDVYMLNFDEISFRARGLSNGISLRDHLHVNRSRLA